ncbi:hypothetical protein Pcinc_023084 [Petrolisthes cinctipes]|uniref:BHLH domain-containing protein n=1 Tax=Petrolisthes cinctipes TaxID=88211 RepID=A0AAE1FCZ2_PETCI|nr:hypothetical protein Pcinc_023084 [Petrolisthes cinctipes]
MSDAEGSPGRQRRSTEKSLENIREYVKLLGRKVTNDSSGQRSPSSAREGNSPTSSAPTKLKFRENTEEEETSTTQPSLARKSGKLDTKLAKENMDKRSEHSSVSKSLKAKRSIESDRPSSNSVSIAEGTGENAIGQAKASKNDGTGKAERNASDTSSGSGKRDVSSAKNKESGKDSSGDTSPMESKKGTTPKGEKSELKSDSPPDLILFLKEGRGRAQNWSEPPTLDPESIATRRRTRVPEDPASLVLGKSKQVVSAKSKKEGKETKKDLRKERKIKVMDTPESLKRLAQEYPLRDSVKPQSNNSSSKGTTENTSDNKSSKRISGKLSVDSDSAAASSSDEQQIPVAKKCKGKMRTSVDGTGTLQTSKDSSTSSGTHHGNIGTVFTRMSKSKADNRSPVMAMSDSDTDTELNKSTPKNKKIQSSSKPGTPNLYMPASEKLKTEKGESIDDQSGTSSQEKEAIVTNKSKKSDAKVENILGESETSMKTDGNKPGPTTASKTLKGLSSSVIAHNASQNSTSISQASKSLAEKATNHSEENLPEKNKASVFESSKPVAEKVVKHTQENPIEKNKTCVSEACTSPAEKPEKDSHEDPSHKVSPSGAKSANLKESHVADVKNKTSVTPSKGSQSLLVSGTSASKPETVQNVLDIPVAKYRVAPAGCKEAIQPTSKKSSSGVQNVQVTPTQQPGTKGAEKVTNVKAKGMFSNIVKVMPVSNTNNEKVSVSQKSNLPVQRGVLIDYTDIETEEVVVGGESEESNSSGQMYSVGKLSTKVDVVGEELGSSSEDDNSTKVAELCPLPRKEVMSPEGRVALDHSYSSGSCESNKGSGSARKKSTVTYEKTMTPRPVYSSASLAKRSLDIMLHNDKINILRQMSQIFNHEKPPSDTDNMLFSSDTEEENEVVVQEKTKAASKVIKDRMNKVKKDLKKMMKESKDEAKEGKTTGNKEDNLVSGRNVVKHVVKNSGEQCSTKAICCSSESQVSENVSSTASKVTSTSKPVYDQEHSKLTTTTPVDGQDSCKPSTSTATGSSSSASLMKKDSGVLKTDEKNSSKPVSSPKKDSPFLGFPDPDPKVHHVPSYPVAADEKIQVSSTVGPGGETVDIIDGFSFISFKSLDEMVSYDNKQGGKTLKIRRRWLRKKRKRGRRFNWYQKRKPLSDESSYLVSESQPHTPQDISSSKDSGAFASNDLDAFLDNNSRLNISYTIPKCQATEEGVKKTIADEILGNMRKSPSPSPSTKPELTEPQSPTSTQPDSLQNEDGPSSVHQYEEVNAIDILYPKEKYKYYYNKELCKETKADGSSVFVRRGGNLVPLTSVFKKQNSTPEPGSSSKKFVDLVYVYDGGQLLTLGGSLTKINPSNSDSVRARVILPVGVPPIMKGEAVCTRSRNIKAVEINEDMAKFALTALRDSNPTAPKNPDVKDEPNTKFPVEPDPSSSVEKVEKSESCEDAEVQKKRIPPKITKKEPVKPTKTNILDIIAAKLAISEDEDTDGGDELEDVKTKKSDNSTDTHKNAVKSSDDAEKRKDSIVDDKKCETEMDSEKEKCDVKEPKSDDKKNESKKKTVVEQLSDNVKEEEEDAVLKENVDTEKNTLPVKPVIEIGEKSDSTMKTVVVEESKQKDGEDENKSENNIEQTTEEKGTDDKMETNEAFVSSPLSSDINSSKSKDSESMTESNGTETSKEIKKCDNQYNEQTEKSSEEETSIHDIDADQAEKTRPTSDSVKIPPPTLSSENTSSSSVFQDGEDGSGGDSKVPGDIDMTKIQDVKSRIFKRNMYRFPSLSREMKRLNMNFVNYVPREAPTEDVKDVIPKECTNEHCKLGCVCDSLLCQQRSVEHCGRVECMFECICRDESWKHSVSSAERSINSVSIFNLDREQNEGLAIREKDFKRTVIQTGSEVILVGAEKKKRERRIPDRFRDSTMWPDTDDVEFETSRICDPPSVQEVGGGIPLSEASKYIKNFKLNIPWYDVTGISIWCMDHSCYDCRCLTDPTFDDPLMYSSVKGVNDRCYRKMPTASDVLERSLKKKPLDQVDIENQSSEDLLVCIPHCIVVNIIVNNTEARRRYSWKLKEWSHSLEVHCARSAGYTKQGRSEETKNMTISGLAAKDTSPEQLVESVVKSLRTKNETLKLPILPCGETFEPFMGDSLAELQHALGLTDEDTKKVSKAKKTECEVPVVDLTASNVEDAESNTVKLVKVRASEGPEFPSKLRGILKRRLSGGSEGQSSAAKKIHLAQSMHEDSLTDKALASQLEQQQQHLLSTKMRPAKTLKAFMREHQLNAQSLDKSAIKKSLSLLEMMTAEEKRGELELDLTDNVPGNALLVAEARFRKLINMNIIGVVGINKAGRCIIGTVDSIHALRVMQRIHNMIINNTLDVGPNMREIFFPPPYVGTRPRFVMIRCDLNRKWEIVGVVQKKGPAATKPYEHKGSRASISSSKPSSSAPQVIDLEEEEQKDKERENTGNDNKDLIETEDADKVEPLSPTDKDGGGTWEGSLPMIASVHSASDPNMAEIIGPDEIPEKLPPTPETPSEEPHTEPSSEGLGTGSLTEGLSTEPTSERPRTEPLSVAISPKPTSERSLAKPVSVPKSIPDLVPIPANIIEKLGHEIKTSESMNTPAILPNPVQIGQSLEQPPKQLFFVPTAFNVASKSSSSTSSLNTPPQGLKTMRLNMTSGKLQGNNNNNPPVSRAVSPVLPAQDSHGLGKLNIILPKDNINLAKSDPSITINKEGTGLKQPNITPGAIIRPTLPTMVSGSSQGAGPTALPNPRMLCLPTSGGMSKVVLVPSVTSGQSPRMMLLPTVPGANVTDSSKMRMVLMPSPQDSSKMILIPTPSIPTTETSDISQVSGGSGTAPSDADKKKMVVLSSNLLGNFLTRPPSVPAEQISKSQPSGSALLSDVSCSQKSCKGTLFVPIGGGTNVQTKSPIGLKADIYNPLPGKQVKTAEDTSDDVVVIGSAQNSLTITRMRTSSESSVTQIKPHCSSSSLLVPPMAVSVASSTTAETFVVNTVTPVSSTIPVSSTGSEKTTSAAGSLENVESVSSSASEENVTASSSSQSYKDTVVIGDTHASTLSEVSVKPESNNKRKILASKARESHESAHSSQQTDDDKNGVEVVKETKPKVSPIKKVGYHWSAVDLSLNFKSVKLEWLLGTIRKNVLVNIYKMSQKTFSPVTLSVKNGMCTSMLYGLARSGGDQQNEPTSPPVLILGSVVSAVMSSSSTPDTVLFQLNSIKYFIRESTGELSSYTYDASGEYLIKVASKKRGDGGEMVGIGEKVPVQKMREQGESLKVSQQPQAEAKTNNDSGGKQKSALDSQSGQDDGGCSCTTAGDFMCMGHSSTQEKKMTDSPIPMVDQSTLPKPASEKHRNSPGSSVPPLEVSGDILKTTLLTSEGKLCKMVSRSKSPPDSQSVCSTTISKLKVQVSKSKQKSNNKEQGDLENITSDQTYSTGKKKSNIQSHDKVELTDKELEEDIQDSISDPMSGVKIVSVQGSQPLIFSDVPATDNQPEKNTTNKPLESDLADSEGEEDIDIVGSDDNDPQSILSILRQQMEDEGRGSRVKTSTSSFSTPAEVAKRLLTSQADTSIQGQKRKIDEIYQGEYERPCPRSKKTPKSSQMSGKLAKQLKLESADVDMSMTPSHLAHLKPGSTDTTDTIPEEDISLPGPSGNWISPKVKFNVIPAKQSKLGKTIVRLKKKEKAIVDVEGYTDERNTEMHNELERMRRKVMRHLFCHLQKCIARVHGSPLYGETSAQPKNSILSVSSKVCEMLRVEEMKLWLQEEKIRQERSSMIKKLATVIADAPEGTRMLWRQWVRDNMQNPTGKQAFERKWTPFNLEKDILRYKPGEASFDIDVDDGSPLPGPSSPLLTVDKPLQPQLPKQKPTIIKTDTSKGASTSKVMTNIAESSPPKPGKVPSDQTGKPSVGLTTSVKLGRGRRGRGRWRKRGQKLVLDNTYQGASTPADSVSIPTSIILMAGTSSRGRKLVRKEDINFVPK